MERVSHVRHASKAACALLASGLLMACAPVGSKVGAPTASATPSQIQGYSNPVKLMNALVCRLVTVPRMQVYNDIVRAGGPRFKGTKLVAAASQDKAAVCSYTDSGGTPGSPLSIQLLNVNAQKQVQDTCDHPSSVSAKLQTVPLPVGDLACLGAGEAAMAKGRWVVHLYGGAPVDGRAEPVASMAAATELLLEIAAQLP